jgi:hypothetical protein
VLVCVGLYSKSKDAGVSYEKIELESPSSLSVLPCPKFDSGVDAPVCGGSRWRFVEECRLCCLLRWRKSGMSVDLIELCGAKPLKFMISYEISTG